MVHCSLYFWFLSLGSFFQLLYLITDLQFCVFPCLISFLLHISLAYTHTYDHPSFKDHHTLLVMTHSLVQPHPRHLFK